MQKFKVWESQKLYDLLVETTAIKQGIEAVLLKEECSLEELPDSLVPTELLYSMVDSYRLLLETLQEAQLVSGKQSKNIH